MTYKLFLDDERSPSEKTPMMVVRSFDEATSIVTAFGPPSFISFDHDLGENSKTGSDFATWLIDYYLDLGFEPKTTRLQYYVHSQNPVGAANIRAKMDSFFLAESL